MRSERIALALAAVSAVGACVVLLWMWKPALAPHAAAARPNVLVIDIDTFSADHFGVVRDGVSNTPNLDALAARGVRFTHAFAQSGWTGPSLNAVLTGVLPVPARQGASGGVKWRGAGVRDLPEILGYYGYATTAFWGVTLAREMGPVLSRNFATVHTSAPADGSTPTDTDPPTQEVLDFLAGPHPAPFFAYVHDVDLHRALTFAQLDPADPLADPSLWMAGQNYQDVYEAARARMGDAAAQAAVLAHYDRMIATYDARVGLMLKALQDHGLADSTIVIVTSDHGNDFFEHANIDHGLLYDTTLRVPLVIHDPRASTPAVVDDEVQLVDIAPTVLQLLGIPVDAGMDGKPLSAYLGVDAPAYTPRPVYALSDSCHVGWRESGLKLILRDHQAAHRDWYPIDLDGPRAVLLQPFLAARGWTDAPMPDCTSSEGDAAATAPITLELYDLRTDPGERANVAADRPDDVERLLRALLGTLSGGAASLAGAAADAMTPEQVEQMKAQGYWGFVAPAKDAPAAP